MKYLRNRYAFKNDLKEQKDNDLAFDAWKLSKASLLVYIYFF